MDEKGTPARDDLDNEDFEEAQTESDQSGETAPAEADRNKDGDTGHDDA